VYTTNAIESLNMQLRKIIKTRGHFPNDEAAIKLLWLALRNVLAKCHGAALWSQCGVGIRAPLEGRHIGASPRAA
ncbi:transposase, partial [Burkholderia cenocepacia]